MLTKEQEDWINHLSDTGSVKIAPFDPESSRKFEVIKKEVQSILGTDREVLHMGASGLGISGQPEIDVYIPVAADDFDKTTLKLQEIFGKPYSIYPMERVKFMRSVEGTKIELMIVNESRKSWIDNKIFFSYLKNNSNALERYRKLKEEGAGLSNRSYYRKKIEFINEILSKAN